MAAGIFLAGTSAATIDHNGRGGTAMDGIFGGSTTVHWDPATRRLVPDRVWDAAMRAQFPQPAA